MKIKKAITTAAFVLTLSAGTLHPTLTVSASSQSRLLLQSENSVSPRSYAAEWIYKVENGKLYKRLYNASIRTWIGDWIYVGEYPG